MAMPSDRELYVARCNRVGAVARSYGATLEKVAGRHELRVTSASGSVVFPIVTDESAWQQTTADEALYAVLLDARSWSEARVDDASLAALDAPERTEVPLIRRELSEELDRIAQLTQVLGGRERLEQLWATADLAAT